MMQSDPTFLLENFIAQTKSAQHAVVLGRDGIKLWWTSSLNRDEADKWSAIASGAQSIGISSATLLNGVSPEEGRDTVRSMTDFPGGTLYVVEVSDFAHLAVVTDTEADPGVVTNDMVVLVEQIGQHIDALPRTTYNAGSSGADALPRSSHNAAAVPSQNGASGDQAGGRR